MNWRPIALLVLAGMQSATAAEADIDRRSFVRLAPSVIKVEAIDKDGHYAIGSAVIVAPERVVTNCHVTRRARNVAAIQGGVRLQARSQAADVRHDLCVLQVPGLEGRGAAIGHRTALKPGQPLLALGYTGGIGLQLSEGRVVALHRWDDAEVIQSDNWFTSGASGGGLFDANGDLVGVLTFRLRGGAAHYFAAPVQWLQGVLANDQGFEPIAPLVGPTYWELPQDLQPYFLQAAVMARGSQWRALEGLALRWSAQDGDDPEAYRQLALAYEQQGRLDESIDVLKRHVSANAVDARSWLQLGLLYKKAGRDSDLRLVQRTLDRLDTQLARQLTDAPAHP
jgi:serine protease Do